MAKRKPVADIDIEPKFATAVHNLQRDLLEQVNAHIESFHMETGMTPSLITLHMASTQRPGITGPMNVVTYVLLEFKV